MEGKDESSILSSLDDDPEAVATPSEQPIVAGQSAPVLDEETQSQPASLDESLISRQPSPSQAEESVESIALHEKSATGTASSENTTPIRHKYTRKRRASASSKENNAVMQETMTTAATALQELVTSISRKDTTAENDDYIDIFFNSLAAQFRLIPDTSQPQVMLNLQQCITSARRVDPPATPNQD